MQSKVIIVFSIPANATEEYIKIGESTTLENIKRFCRTMVKNFSEQYLRALIVNDIARLLHIGQQHGFLGMLGSLDCMHWKWKNCPTGCVV